MTHTLPLTHLACTALLALLSLTAGCTRPLPEERFEEVTAFGSNPGQLRMFKYIPDPAGTQRRSSHPLQDPTQKAANQGAADPRSRALPLVVALHGCMQNARGYGEKSGWLELADRLQILLLLPQQRITNNLTRCFNWFSPADNQRDEGEALSIRQMIERMRRDYRIDQKKVFVTGLSAGGAMTTAMLAGYPDVFAAGAPIAGVPFGCADGLSSALACLGNLPDLEHDRIVEKIRANSDFNGLWPRISVWQGATDRLVDPANMTAIARQWTSLQGVGPRPTARVHSDGSIHSIYRDPIRGVVTETHLIHEMGHGVPVDPGEGKNQCGSLGRYFLDVDICASLNISRFWGLVGADEEMAGSSGEEAD